MALPFLETPRFPENISEGSSGGPEFKTFVFEGHTAIEQRHQAWSRARAKYDVGYGIRDNEDMDVVRDFFYAMRGRATGFRFKDWGDYQLDQEQIGVGDGVEVEFPIIKTYTAGALSYVRRIFKPISGTVVVRVNDVVVSASDYTVDFINGIITFDTAVTDTHTIKVTCEFDTPVRFDTDHFSPEHEGWRSQNWSSIPLVEILLEEPA